MTWQFDITGDIKKDDRLNGDTKKFAKNCEL